MLLGSFRSFQEHFLSAIVIKGVFFKKMQNLQKTNQFKLVCHFFSDILYFPYGRTKSRNPPIQQFKLMLFEVSLKPCKPHMAILLKKINFSCRMPTLFCFENGYSFPYLFPLFVFFHIHVRAFISFSSYFVYAFFQHFRSACT